MELWLMMLVSIPQATEKLYDKFRASVGSMGGNVSKPYRVEKGRAKIPVTGVLERNLSFFGWLYGGTSTQEIAKKIKIAEADYQVESIDFVIDSPGGEVEGTSQLAEAIYAVKKPTRAIVEGSCASAAYWIASATDEILLTSGTNVVGSIGVVVSHTDMSKALEMQGKKVTEITAGQFKRVASSLKPLDEAGRSELQSQADYIYSVFVEAVAKFRGKTPKEVLKAADGKIYIGQQAIDIGLADGYLIEGENMDITLELIKKEAPELLGSIQAEATEIGVAKGIEQEQDRIKKIMSLDSVNTRDTVLKAISDPEASFESVSVDIAKGVIDGTFRASMDDLRNREDVPAGAANESPDEDEKEREQFLANVKAGANNYKRS